MIFFLFFYFFFNTSLLAFLVDESIPDIYDYLIPYTKDQKLKSKLKNRMMATFQKIEYNRIFIFFEEWHEGTLYVISGDDKKVDAYHFPHIDSILDCQQIPFLKKDQYLVITRVPQGLKAGYTCLAVLISMEENLRIVSSFPIGGDIFRVKIPRELVEENHPDASYSYRIESFQTESQGVSLKGVFECTLWGAINEAEILKYLEIDSKKEAFEIKISSDWKIDIIARSKAVRDELILWCDGSDTLVYKAE